MCAPTLRRMGLGSFRNWASRSGSISIAKDCLKVTSEPFGGAFAADFLRFGIKLFGYEIQLTRTEPIIPRGSAEQKAGKVSHLGPLFRW